MPAPNLQNGKWRLNEIDMLFSLLISTSEVEGETGFQDKIEAETPHQRQATYGVGQTQVAIN